MTKKILLLSLIAFGLLILVACSGTEEATNDRSYELLTGLQWQLNQLNGKGTLPSDQATITADFGTEGQIAGSAGCNSYSGPYEVTANKISIGPVTTTRKACEERITAQENAYLEALSQTQIYEVNDVELALIDAGGNVVAHYGVVNQNLSGTSWNVFSYNNGNEAVITVIADSNLTAEFGGNGQITGNAGCNSYSGPYKADGNNLTIGPLTSTQKDCSDSAGLMDQEQKYLAALQSVSNYQMHGEMLEMRTESGELAVELTRATGQ